MRKKVPDTWKFRWNPFRNYYFAYAGSMWEDCSLDYMAYQIARGIVRFNRRYATIWRPGHVTQVRFMVDFLDIYYLLLIDVSVDLHFNSPHVTYVNVSIPACKPRKFYELRARDINGHLHKTCQSQ